MGAPMNFLRLGRLAIIVLTLVLQTTCVMTAIAQTGKGTIRGHVTDSSGGVLQGAEVALSPVSLTVATDVQGEFFIRDLNPGKYTVTISYVGFQFATKTVDVAAGQTAAVDASLAVSSDTQQ